MADFDNLSEISENFDTIKTLLNSIRAQGILNTSDVDKLLSGINAKLEKINTEEDIDLIKLFLSELKQNLDERHSVLISKFGAIESLFTNLLKNSSETMKSSELKELFDIIATNLSVFSREVVSQKESLTDITLRIDALRSDDSQKKDIIKNIALLKPDLERLNNGFDSIVISLNDNFKTIIRTISTIDKTEHLDKFADSLTNIDMSVNTVLSALQMLDKKSEQVESNLANVATKEDLKNTTSRIVELSAQSQEINSSITALSDSYRKINSLSDKIDASVNVIASLKSVLEETEDKSTQILLEQLNKLADNVKIIQDDEKFNEFKLSLENILRNIADTSSNLDKNIVSSFEAVLKSVIAENSQRELGLQEANITRVVGEISSNATNLVSKLNETRTGLIALCERNFGSVYEGISSLKSLVSQIDENSVSANNAIFSSITDRLTLFETSLRDSLDLQEQTVTHSSAKLVEHIESIKNLSSVIDYKMDTTVVENANIKKEFGELKTAVENVLALDFVSVVKDLRVDLYASKQELATAFDNANSDLSEKFTNDLFSKYELLITKLDNVEDEVKRTQQESIISLKGILENITSSLIDVKAYVSESKEVDFSGIENKLEDIAESVTENRLDYIDSLRNITETIKNYFEDSLKNFDTVIDQRFDKVKRSISENTEDLKKDLKYSYSKLLEIQDSQAELKDILAVNKANETEEINKLLVSNENVKVELNTQATELKTQIDNSVKSIDKASELKVDSLKSALSEKTKTIQDDIKNSYSKLLEIQNFHTELKDILALNKTSETEEIKEIITSNEIAKQEIETKISEIKSQLTEKIEIFKQELTCENTDKVSELKFAVENLYTKNSTEILTDINELKTLIKLLQTNSGNDRIDISNKIEDGLVTLKNYMSVLSENTEVSLADKFESVLNDFSLVKEGLDKLNDDVDGDMTRQLSIIESNFESLVSQVTILFEKSDNALSEKINNEFAQVSENMQSTLIEKLDTFKLKLDNSFDEINSKASCQSEYLHEQVEGLNTALTQAVTSISEENLKQISVIAENLKSILDNNAEKASVDYKSLKEDLGNFSNTIEKNNKNTTQNIKAQLDDIAKYIDSILDIQTKEFDARQTDVIDQLNNTSTAVMDKVDITADIATSIKNDIEVLARVVGANKAQLAEFETKLDAKTTELKQASEDVSANELQVIDAYIKNIEEQFEYIKQTVATVQDTVNEVTKQELSLISKNIEKETDAVISELIEQFDILKKNQADDIINLSSRVEEIVNATVYNNIEDLKAYLDVKTDNSIVEAKLDNLKIEMLSSAEGILSGLNNVLTTSTFSSAMSDLKADNENNFASFDNKLATLFDDLKSQVANKAFEEAFQDTVNQQISGLEDLIKEQMSYIEDINSLCETNLPDVTEMNVLLKGSLSESVKSFTEKLDSINIETVLDDEFTKFKSDIITQFINVFNQVSFIAEQEEILDFIQEKHDDLITVLSHIVTTNETVDSKIDTLRDDIESINEKISSIISAEGDVDYIYSLHDLESDIANLRLVLNEMKSQNNSEEFTNLVSSTNEIYTLVETLRSEMPSKFDFDSLNEDIVSISTRTNKLILASDESYKTLQDNLQDFKLVINDLDERTRNFSREAGLDKIDNKLNALNSMMVNGAKTNQVFNQVFEYLAEWVDNASTQINTISNKVETLDDIGQIKAMLTDLKEGAEDSSFSEELVDALGSIFDKQSKKISTIEKKIDKIIVDSTLNNNLDISPIEATLNRFLVAMDEKFTTQQNKINQLEARLEDVLNRLEEKDTAQLTKKVGGMDRQIAKLNKSIEKIASHVVEK